MKLFVFSLIFLLPMGAIQAQPENGVWVSDETPGTAYVLQRERNTLYFSWLSYSETGESAWHIAFGEIEEVFDSPDRVVNLELQTYVDGPCPGCTWSAPILTTSPGTIRLVFSGNAEGALTYGDTTMSIRPFVANHPRIEADSYFTGTWVLYFEQQRETQWMELGDIEYPFNSSNCSPACLAFHPILDSSLDLIWLTCAPQYSQFRGCYLYQQDVGILVEFHIEDIGRDSMIGVDRNGDRVFVVRVVM